MTQPGDPPIRTEAVKLTDVGQSRTRNQDFVEIEIPGPETLQAKGALYLVADGMGGYQAGEVASRRAGEAIIREYYADPQTDIAASLRRAAQKANAAVYRMAQAGRMPAKRIGRSWRFSQARIDAWIAEGSGGAEPFEPESPAA